MTVGPFSPRDPPICAVAEEGFRSSKIPSKHARPKGAARRDILATKRKNWLPYRGLDRFWISRVIAPGPFSSI